VIGLLFGRRIRVTVGSIVVCDLDPSASEADNEARNLDVEFSCESHAKIEPLKTELTIYGLNREIRQLLTSQQDEARRTAWQKYQAIEVGDVLVEGVEDVAAASTSLVAQGATVLIEAGYGDDFGLIARAQILPDGLEHEYLRPGYVTRIMAQDTRLPWSNAFVSETVVPGVTLADLDRVLEISEGYLSGDLGAGEVETEVPGLLERKVFPGYQNGAVLHGASRDQSAKVLESLGLRPFWSLGQLYYLPTDGTLFDEAVVLQEVGPEESSMSAPSTRRNVTGFGGATPDTSLYAGTPSPGGLLRYKELPRGYLDVHCLLNYRLTPGRQVQVMAASGGAPIGMGLYRVEHAHHFGGGAIPDYYTDAVLRPVTVAPAQNG
jgi:hypothetical protein